MKNLTDLSNTEKGKLLADLFPQEIAPLLDTIVASCQYIKENEPEIKNTWNEKSFASAEFWIGLAAEALRVTSKYRYSLERSSKVFSDQLFYGHIAMFTIECILQYAKAKEDDSKFQLAVELLFG